MMLSKNGYTLVNDFIPLALNSIFLDLILWMISLLTTLSPKELVGLGNTSLTLFCVLSFFAEDQHLHPPTVVANVVGVVTSAWKITGNNTTSLCKSISTWSPPLNKLSNSLAVMSGFSLIVFAPVQLHY